MVSSPECSGTSRFGEAMSGYSGDDTLAGYDRGGFASGRPLSTTPDASPTKAAKGEHLGPSHGLLEDPPATMSMHTSHAQHMPPPVETSCCHCYCSAALLLPAHRTAGAYG